MQGRSSDARFAKSATLVAFIPHQRTWIIILCTSEQTHMVMNVVLPRRRCSRPPDRSQATAPATVPDETAAPSCASMVPCPVDPHHRTIVDAIRFNGVFHHHFHRFMPFVPMSTSNHTITASTVVQSVRFAKDILTESTLHTPYVPTSLIAPRQLIHGCMTRCVQSSDPR